MQVMEVTDWFTFHFVLRAGDFEAAALDLIHVIGRDGHLDQSHV